MVHAINPARHLKLGEGPFRTRRIRLDFGMEDERGDRFGPLGIVDLAYLSAELVVDMHEHRDDEIVSCLRSSMPTHEDSDGNREAVTRDRLTVMNAGSKTPAAPSGHGHNPDRLRSGDGTGFLKRNRHAALREGFPCISFERIDKTMYGGCESGTRSRPVETERREWPI